MKRRIERKLETIFEYRFFQSVAEPLPPSVTPVTSWSRAAKECGAQKWANCQLMARNALQRFTEIQCWDRAQDWNPILQEIRPLISIFCEALVRKTDLPEKLLTAIKTDLSWDIMFICLEHEFSDVVQPFFYIPLLDPWYAAGHFPCGWDGPEFPDRWDGVVREGQLIVF
jgi:hypothetical protein